MQITNKLDLPKPFVDAVSRDYEFKDKRYSVTSMLKGSREIILSRRHWNEMCQDASDSIWMILGTAAHRVLEDAKEGDDELKETKIYYEFPNGYTLSGQQDLYSESLKRITDYKTGSVWKVIFDEWDDYRTQCLYYALLFRKIGFECDNAEIVMILKDWSKTDAKIKRDYPQHPVFKKHFDFSEEDFDQAEKVIQAKFEEIEKLQDVSDRDLPICSDKERWAKPTQYAVMKHNGKRAVKLFDNLRDANQMVMNKGGDYVQIREGEDRKCMDYCSCCDYCSYWKEKYGNKN